MDLGEVLRVVRAKKPGIEVKRAVFSALTFGDITHAVQNLQNGGWYKISHYNINHGSKRLIFFVGYHPLVFVYLLVDQLTLQNSSFLHPAPNHVTSPNVTPSSYASRDTAIIQHPEQLISKINDFYSEKAVLPEFIQFLDSIK